MTSRVIIMERIGIQMPVSSDNLDLSDPIQATPSSPNPSDPSLVPVSCSRQSHAQKTKSFALASELSHKISHPRSQTASDIVSTYNNWPADVLLETVIFKQRSITILDLAIVCDIIHKSQSRYHLFDFQCIWFSGVMIRVLKKAFALSIITPTCPPLRPSSTSTILSSFRKKPNLEEPPVAPPRFGTTPPTEEHVEKICALFLTERVAVLERVYAARDAASSKDRNAAETEIAKAEAENAKADAKEARNMARAAEERADAVQAEA
ncbi:hypothetical protein BDQ12DRAFT_694577, partial [Crucibulum laeve]